MNFFFFFKELRFAAQGLQGEDSTRRVTSARSGGQKPRTQSLVFIYSVEQAGGGEGRGGVWGRGGEGEELEEALTVPLDPVQLGAQTSTQGRSVLLQGPRRGSTSCARVPSLLQKEATL